MTVALRQYQTDLINAIDYDLEVRKLAATLGVSPTGSGKTVTFSEFLKKRAAVPTCAVAHRQELVSQISCALAREGVRHTIMAPRAVVKKCVAQHVKKFGRSFYSTQSKTTIAGVDTLIKKDGTGKDGDLYFQHVRDKLIAYGPRTNGRWGSPRAHEGPRPPGAKTGKTPPKDRDESLMPWRESIRYWVIDEAHHVLRDNKWGHAVRMFPNAQGLGVTATPIRADGYGLGAHADGVFENMILGPSMRQLIELGYLTDYRFIGVKTEGLDMSQVELGATGDYKHAQASKAMRKSKIVGSVVESYLKFAPGKKGVTFATSLQDAHDMAKAFRDAEVPAVVAHADSSEDERDDATEGLASGKYLMLVNVDLFGEGFDLPAIEVVIMARPTKSVSLYIQQFGRALRLMISESEQRKWENYTPEQRKAIIAQSSKPKAIVIDHVNNLSLGLPDAAREWSLNGREKSRSGTSDVIPTTVCLECFEVYERYHTKCPFCGNAPVPADRSGPEKVDGDLEELAPDVLARMRGEVARVDRTPEEVAAEMVAKHVPQIGVLRNVNLHKARQAAVGDLRSVMAWWAGLQESRGLDLRQSQRLFFHTFGTDVLSAQTLKTDEAGRLAERVTEDLKKRLR